MLDSIAILCVILLLFFTYYHCFLVHRYIYKDNGRTDQFWLNLSTVKYIIYEQDKNKIKSINKNKNKNNKTK